MWWRRGNGKWSWKWRSQIRARKKKGEWRQSAKDWRSYGIRRRRTGGKEEEKQEVVFWRRVEVKRRGSRTGCVPPSQTHWRHFNKDGRGDDMQTQHTNDLHHTENRPDNWILQIASDHIYWYRTLQTEQPRTEQTQVIQRLLKWIQVWTRHWNNWN